MQIIRLVLLQAALAAGQLSDPWVDGTSSMGNALRATAEGEKPAVAMPSNLHTDYSSSNVVSNLPAPTATVSPDASAEIPIPNNPPDEEADLPVGSTGVDDAELEGGSPQALVSDQPVPAPVLSETAPPDTPVQTPEQAASPLTEITGALTSKSPSNPIATTLIIALNQRTSSDNFIPVSNKNPAQTPVVTPSPAETTKAAILAVPDPSSQVSELPPPSAPTLDPSFSSPIVSTSFTAVAEAAVSEAAAATTFLSVITAPSSSDSAFIALVTDSSSSSVISPSPTSFPDHPLFLSSISSITAAQPAMTFNGTFNISSNNTSNNGTSLDASEDTSLQPVTTAFPAHSSSNEYLSSQAKVAIVLVSVVGVLAVMAVIGYVLWHMRLRDQRLERGRRAAAAAAASGRVDDDGNFDGVGVGIGIGTSGVAGKEGNLGGAGAGAGGAMEESTGEAGKEGGGPRGQESGNGPKRTLIRFEDKTERGLQKEQGVPLNFGGKLHSDEAPGRPAVAVNRSRTLSERSESSEGSDISTASRKEIAVGYGLRRSESQESEESHYSEGSGNEFRRMETLDGQRARYAHERSESLRSQWSDVQDYYGIERLETEVPAGQGPGSGSAGNAVAGAEALGSEETLVRTESNSSTASGKSGQSIGKAL